MVIHYPFDLENSHVIFTIDSFFQTQTQSILFNSNNHICKYKVKTETPMGLFAFYSWKSIHYCNARPLRMT